MRRKFKLQPLIVVALCLCMVHTSSRAQSTGYWQKMHIMPTTSVIKGTCVSIDDKKSVGYAVDVDVANNTSTIYKLINSLIDGVYFEKAWTQKNALLFDIQVVDTNIVVAIGAQVNSNNYPEKDSNDYTPLILRSVDGGASFYTVATLPSQYSYGKMNAWQKIITGTKPDELFILGNTFDHDYAIDNNNAYINPEFVVLYSANGGLSWKSYSESNLGSLLGCYDINYTKPVRMSITSFSKIKDVFYISTKDCKNANSTSYGGLFKLFTEGNSKTWNTKPLNYNSADGIFDTAKYYSHRKFYYMPYGIDTAIVLHTATGLDVKINKAKNEPAKKQSYLYVGCHQKFTIMDVFKQHHSYANLSLTASNISDYTLAASYNVNKRRITMASHTLYNNEEIVYTAELIGTYPIGWNSTFYEYPSFFKNIKGSIQQSAEIGAINKIVDNDKIRLLAADKGFYYWKEKNSNSIAESIDAIRSSDEKDEIFLTGNPSVATPITTISFSLKTSGKAILKVYNAMGEMMQLLYNRHAEAGKTYSALFDGSKLPGGIYTCVLETATKKKSTQLILVK